MSKAFWNRQPTLLLATLLLLGACQTTSVTTPLPTASKKPSTATVPSEPTSPTVPPTPSPVPSPSPTVASRLETPAPLPAGKTISLAGLVSLDASYILSNHGGSLTGKAKIVSDSGGNVLIVGNSLLSNNGSGLIADSGSSVVSQAGGGLTTKTKYALLDAAPEASVLLGEILPIGGMEVTVISLATGLPLELLDTAGKPFYPVYTDSQGKYLAPVPESQKDNFLIVARVPESEDPRLKYAQMVQMARSQSTPIDADHATVSTMIRTIFSRQMQDMMLTPDPAGLAIYLLPNAPWPPQFRQKITEMVFTLSKAAREAGLDKVPRARTDALAAKVADAVLAHVDLEAIIIDPALVPDWPGPAEPAVAAASDIVRQVRLAAQTKMRDNPAFFETQPYILAAKSTRSPKPAVQILRPEDLSDFVMDEFLQGVGKSEDENIREVYHSVDLFKDATTGFELADRLSACRTSLALRIGMNLALNETGTMDEALALIAASAKNPVP